jgi:hypothetical protein
MKKKNDSMNLSEYSDRILREEYDKTEYIED